MLPLGLSDNGVVVGLAQGDRQPGGFTPRPSELAIWAETNGLVLFSDYVESLGVDATGWDFAGSTDLLSSNLIDISSDGLVLMGSGLFNGEIAAWRLALVPEPHTLTTLALRAGLRAAARRRR